MEIENLPPVDGVRRHCHVGSSRSWPRSSQHGSQLLSMYNFNARAMLTGVVPPRRVTESRPYHCVPARTHGAYTLPDMFTSSCSTQSSMSHPDYTSSSDRPTAKPSQVRLDPRKVLPSGRKNRRTPSRGMNPGFFPPVKLRGSMPDLKRSSSMKTPPFSSMELAPESPESAASSMASAARASPAKSDPRYTTYPPVYPGVLPDTQGSGDFTQLPKPKMVISRGDIPWVYRYKVKKSMNELGKIMASKPQNNQELGYTYSQTLLH